MTKKIRVAAALLTVAAAFSVWMAIAFAQVIGPPKARADLFDNLGQPAGYVVISEIPGPYLQSQINLSGKLTAPPGTRGVHLWNVDCANVLSGEGGNHLSLGAPAHPADIGDLPNITPGATGTFSLTKVTNRFVLGAGPLNVFNYSPLVTVVVDAGPDLGEGGAPRYCGYLNCVPGTQCQGGAN